MPKELLTGRASRPVFVREKGRGCRPCSCTAFARLNSLLANFVDRTLCSYPIYNYLLTPPPAPGNDRAPRRPRHALRPATREDIRVSPVGKRLAIARHAAEVAERRAIFGATNSSRGAAVLHCYPFHAQARHADASSFGGPGRAWGWNEAPPQTKKLQKL
jgi:hypothetical protein